MRRAVAAVAAAGLVGVASADAQEPTALPVVPAATAETSTAPESPPTVTVPPASSPAVEPGVAAPPPPVGPSSAPPTVPPSPSGTSGPGPGPADLRRIRPADEQPVTDKDGNRVTLGEPGPAARKRARRKAAQRRREATERKRALARKAREKQAAKVGGDTPSDALADGAALPGLSLGEPIPSFLIERFRIPPFLLPIYQAAGVEYGVRWEVLAAINEIETDYGRNLNVSTAGAEGWMQFIPSTWEQYGVDANGDGRRDPYNPVDAIFAAARYLKAAGYEQDVRRSIFAYNHADWYVNSVLARAKLISLLPGELVGSLTGLTEGRFPVAASASYPTRVTPAALRKRSKKATLSSEGEDGRREISVATEPGARVVATQDGEVTRIGDSPALGRYVQLRDVYGNTYTYANLGTVAKTYLTPKDGARPSARRAADSATSGLGPDDASTQLGGPTDAAPAGAPLRAVGSVGPRSAAEEPRVVDPDARPERSRRTAGRSPSVAEQPGGAPSVPTGPSDSELRRNLIAAHDAGVRPVSRGATSPARVRVAAAPRGTTAKPRGAAARLLSAQERALRSAVVASPSPEAAIPGQPRQLPDPARSAMTTSVVRPAGLPTLPGAASARRTTYTPYQRRLLGGLKQKDVVSRRLKGGSAVVGGTVLGRVGEAARPHLRFRIRPAGEGTPLIDPTPILDGWRLLDSTAIYRTSGRSVLRPEGTSVGQILLESKDRLVRRVLADKSITIYACGRRDIAAGLIDRRVLATLAFLAEQDLKPTVSSLRCGHGTLTSSGNVSEHTTGTAIDIAAINGIPVIGHQGPGSITETTIRKLLSLQGTLKPHQIISLMQIPGTDNTLSLPDHADHIHLGWRAAPGAGGDDQNGTLGGALRSSDWDKLVARLNVIDNPFVSSTPSENALPAEKDRK